MTHPSYQLYTPNVIFITGATSGFGAAAARLFAAHIDGVKLILTGRRKDRLEALQNELNVPVHIMCHDIRDTQQVKKDIENIPADFKGVDLLINNAGLALGADSFDTLPLEDAMTMVDVNVKGLLAMTRLLLPNMVANRRGHIINIGSIAGTYPYGGGNVYCGTKAFVNHFSLALRADLKGKNVRVTSVEPGAVETEFSDVRFKGDKERAAKVYEGYRKLTADHIAQSLLWIATQPEEMNINRIEIMPTDQSFNGLGMTPVE